MSGAPSLRPLTAAPHRRLGRLAVFGALLVIGTLTLRPTPPPAIPLPMFCLLCGDLGMVDLVLNVLLFIPLGAALVLAGCDARRAVLVGATTSLAIEALQFAVIPGRDASVSDLLTNSVGSALGAAIALHWRALLAPALDSARLAATVWAAGVMAVMAGTAALLRPSVPPMGMWGQWTPQQLQFEPYTGRVTAFRVDSIDVPYNLVPESEPLRQRLLDGEMRAELHFVAGRAPERLSAIARVGSRHQEALLLGARGDALIFRTRLAARDWRLRAPGLAVPGALPPEGSAAVAVAGVRARHWYARVDAAGRSVERELPFSVALGWTMLLPFDHPLAPGDAWLSALWLAGLIFPAALWGAMAGGARSPGSGFNRWWAIPAGMVTTGLALIPRLAQFAPAAPAEWVGVLVGAALGALLAAPIRRRAERIT